MYHDAEVMKKFKPTIIINPLLNVNSYNSRHSSHLSKNLERREDDITNLNDSNDKSKIFQIEKIKKSENGSQNSQDNYDKSCELSSQTYKNKRIKGKNQNIRIKRMDKYKMFNPRFKQECLKLVNNKLYNYKSLT